MCYDVVNNKRLYSRVNSEHRLMATRLPLGACIDLVLSTG